ncbi:Diaminopimelate epimerase-like protein [Tothia fuscella]|uniref:Diaminopimelate epimerase-like protein n=1 Tax=Tothia fuscella TaxID=1048955 RepID=A0A9P4NET1_9PEZI|nr:Diaminopimelate epimerase-like protein [Tothia fuscella]
MEKSGIDYATLDVFTKEKFTGNQLAVVHIPETGLSQELKQAIAAEFDYSETTFVEKAKGEEGNVWNLNIFITTAELPFAGHPVIGTACYVLSALENENQEIVKGAFLTKAGRVELEYDPAKGTAQAAIPHNIHIHEAPYLKNDLKRLQPSVGRLPEASPVVSIVKGMTFVLVELDSLDSLQFVNTTPYHVNTPFDEGWGDSFAACYLYYKLPSSDSNSRNVRLRTRMIESGLEDAATGSAACTLSSYLSMVEGKAGETVKYEITQGVEMGRRSQIFVDIKLDGKNKVETVHLSGGAVQVMEGKLFV